MTDNGGRGVRNTGGNKYEMTAREIQNYQIGAFFGIWQITLRKVTPTPTAYERKTLCEIL